MADAIATEEDIESVHESDQKASWEHEELAQVRKQKHISRYS